MEAGSNQCAALECSIFRYAAILKLHHLQHMSCIRIAAITAAANLSAADEARLCLKDVLARCFYLIFSEARRCFIALF
jgi:hypothetical protein